MSVLQFARSSVQLTRLPAAGTSTPAPVNSLIVTAASQKKKRKNEDLGVNTAAEMRRITTKNWEPSFHFFFFLHSFPSLQPRSESMTHSYSAPSEEIHKCKWRSKETKALQWLQDTGKTSTSRPGERIAFPKSRVGACIDFWQEP